MDFSNKEIIGIYSYSNFNEDREKAKTEIINGRTYMKFGTATATTVVAIQYKVYNPSINRSEYITLVGVARQNPGDVIVNEEQGYEIATENAMIDPVMTIKYNTKCSEDYINLMMSIYVDGLKVEFIKTRKELDCLNEDVDKYNRDRRTDGDYYAEYYKDYKKIFKKD